MRAPEYIDWFHNGDLIDVKKVQWRNRVAFFNRIPETPGRSLISQLTIEHATTEDAGVYVCRSVTASTDSDVETTSITVHILNGNDFVNVLKCFNNFLKKMRNCFFNL